MPQLPQDELVAYLDRAGLDPDQANEIQARYIQAVSAQGAGSWSRDRTMAWLDDQIAATQGEPEPTRATGATVNAIERSAQQAAAAATQAGSEADERAAAVRQRAQTNYVTDMGAAVDPGMISTSLAVGAWVDNNGNYVDPITHQRVSEPIPADANTVWQMIRGQTFNMGTLAMPGYEERRTRNYTPLRRGFTGTEPGTRGEPPTARLGTLSYPGLDFTERLGDTKFLTPSKAMALLNAMDEDYLVGLQQQMWDAGLYTAVGEGARPDWGRADPVTQKAFQQLFIEASLDPRQPLQQVLADLAERNITNLGDVPGAPGSSTAQAPDFTPQVASTETLGRLIDELAANLLGENVDDKTKADLIARLQGQETDVQRKQYEQDLANFQATPATGGAPGMEDIDIFMQAISGLESGGNYQAENERTGAYGRFQIMPSNWAPWAARAGLGPGAPRTPENQEIVAKRIMMDYYAQFGNWRDVAVAWFAGPGAVGQPGAMERSDGNITVAEYSNRILDKMAALKGGAAGIAAGATMGGQEYPAIERFDPAAEAEAALKAANPNAWFGHQWGNRATEFYNLLAGVA
jgi:hypothetical protein